MNDYYVVIGSPAGPEVEKYKLTWDEALTVADDFKRRYPRWLITVGNQNYADSGCSGLTEDEIDELHTRL